MCSLVSRECVESEPIESGVSHLVVSVADDSHQVALVSDCWREKFEALSPRQYCVVAESRLHQFVRMSEMEKRSFHDNFLILLVQSVDEQVDLIQHQINLITMRNDRSHVIFPAATFERIH